MALVLTRKIHQSIMIGEDVKVTVTGIDRGVVRLSFECPSDTPVHREEIFKKLKAEGSGLDVIMKSKGGNK